MDQARVVAMPCPGVARALMQACAGLVQIDILRISQSGLRHMPFHPLSCFSEEQAPVICIFNISGRSPRILVPNVSSRLCCDTEPYSARSRVLLGLAMCQSISECERE